MSDSPYEPKGVKSLFGGRTKKGRRLIERRSGGDTQRDAECREIWRLAYSSAVGMEPVTSVQRQRARQCADEAVEDYLERFYSNDS